MASSRVEITAGLSPRVRGSHMIAAVAEAEAGSIPARAGEPHDRGGSRGRSRVYPRACGGASIGCCARRRRGGLSPRVRGSQRQVHEAARFAGSIPARAGEPGAREKLEAKLRVYPRACGGAAPGSCRLWPPEGLSPRVRGSRAGALDAVRPLRSIPARAGEPRRPRRRPGRRGVYPRACGGAALTAAESDIASGLSPRVRGSRNAEAARVRKLGSIPARAGEPSPAPGRGAAPAVYPRACGGAVSIGRRPRRASGLSPRVRGSQRAQRADRDPAGSIPARAGEPEATKHDGPRRGVYPRACGGARRIGQDALLAYGLSPRVRGSRRARDPHEADHRSIPARAGEPRRPRRRPARRRVYPRACGGANFWSKPRRPE